MLKSNIYYKINNTPIYEIDSQSYNSMSLPSYARISLARDCWDLRICAVCFKGGEMVLSGDLLEDGRDILRLSSRSGDLALLRLSSLTSIFDMGTPLVMVDI